MAGQIGNMENDKAVIENAYDFALQLMSYLAETLGCTTYSWSDGFFRKEAKRAIEKCREETIHDPTFWPRVFCLPFKERLSLGFRFWDDESKEQGLMLMPLWIYAVLPDDFQYKGLIKSEMDDDTRFGCVFWEVG